MWNDKLKAMKKSSGLNTKEISEKSGVPLGTLNKIFAGQTINPKLSTMRNIVHSLGYSLDDLVDNNVTPNKDDQELLNIYRLAKRSERAEIKVLIKAIDKLLGIDEQSDGE